MRKFTTVERYNKLLAEYEANYDIKYDKPDKAYRTAKEKKDKRLIKQVLNFWPNLMGKTLKVPVQYRCGCTKAYYVKIDGIILANSNRVEFNVKPGFEVPIGSMLHATELIPLENFNYNTRITGGVGNFVHFEEISEEEWKKQQAKVVSGKKVENAIYSLMNKMQRHIYDTEMVKFRKAKPYSDYETQIKKLQDQINKLADKQRVLEYKFEKKWIKNHGEEFLKDEIEKELVKNPYTYKEATELRQSVGKQKKNS